MPDGVKQLRAVIVHQHGCGFDANRCRRNGRTRPHWQALAAKWDAALLAPHYKQTAQGREGCDLWSDRAAAQRGPSRGLDEFAEKSGRELKTAPWCLWGHSGGAYWVSLMQTLAPERIVAAWLRSWHRIPVVGKR
jgi:poly(3-hydroxybutyrate) depolymerase